MYAEVDGGSFAGLDDFLFDLLADFVDDFLDAGGADASVGDELVEGESRDFASHGVEG